MNTTFEVSGWFKTIEEDTWEHGCVGKWSHDTCCDLYSASTLPELITRLKAAFNCTDNGVLIDSCDEPGRIDFQVTENDAGLEPSAAEIEAWKRGEERLWACTYTVHVERVTRETVELSSLLPV